MATKQEKNSQKIEENKLKIQDNKEKLIVYQDVEVVVSGAIDRLIQNFNSEEKAAERKILQDKADAAAAIYSKAETELTTTNHDSKNSVEIRKTLSKLKEDAAAAQKAAEAPAKDFEKDKKILEDGKKNLDKDIKKINKEIASLEKKNKRLEASTEWWNGYDEAMESYEDYVKKGGERLYLGKMESSKYLNSSNVNTSWDPDIPAKDQWGEFFSDVLSALKDEGTDFLKTITGQVVDSILPKLSFDGKGSNGLDQKALQEAAKKVQGSWYAGDKGKPKVEDEIAEKKGAPALSSTPGQQSASGVAMDPNGVPYTPANLTKQLEKMSKVFTFAGSIAGAPTSPKKIFKDILQVIGPVFDGFKYSLVEVNTPKKPIVLESKVKGKNLRTLMNQMIDKELDDSVAFQRIMESDPLLSTHQFNLKLVDKEAATKSEDIGSSANLLSYRIKGMTVPEVKRDVTHKPYGNNQLSLLTNRIPKMEYKATWDIICDKELKVLTNLIDLTGSGIKEFSNENLAAQVTPNDAIKNKYTPRLCEAIYNLSSAPTTGRASNGYMEYGDIAILEVLNGRDLADDYNWEKIHDDAAVIDLPVFLFQNFRILSIDYEFSFSASTSNVKDLIIKAEVAWTKMVMKRVSELGDIKNVFEDNQDEVNVTSRSAGWVSPKTNTSNTTGWIQQGHFLF